LTAITGKVSNIDVYQNTKKFIVNIPDFEAKPDFSERSFISRYLKF